MPRSSFDSSLMEQGGQQVKDARAEHLHQNSAQQQPWPNSRPIYNLFCRVTLTCARPGDPCLRRTMKSLFGSQTGMTRLLYN